jgi:hypothetical protein
MFLNNLWENKTFKKNLATNLSCVEEAAAWRVSTFYFRRKQRKDQQYNSVALWEKEREISINNNNTERYCFLFSAHFVCS